MGEDAARLCRSVDIPLVDVASLAYCREVLERGDVDMLAVGRAMLENPAWPLSA